LQTLTCTLLSTQCLEMSKTSQFSNRCSNVSINIQRFIALCTRHYFQENKFKALTGKIQIRPRELKVGKKSGFLRKVRFLSQPRMLPWKYSKRDQFRRCFLFRGGGVALHGTNCCSFQGFQLIRQPESLYVTLHCSNSVYLATKRQKWFFSKSIFNNLGIIKSYLPLFECLCLPGNYVIRLTKVVE
jgi:hypothetical protein